MNIRATSVILLLIFSFTYFPFSSNNAMAQNISSFKITISIVDFDPATITYQLQVYLDGIFLTPKMAVAKSRGAERGGGYWPVFNIEFKKNENVTILTDEKVIEFSNKSEVFPYDEYNLTLYAAVDVDEPYYVTNGRLRAPYTNYIAFYNISSEEWDTLPQEIPPWFKNYGGKYLYKIDLLISHSEQFKEYAGVVFNEIPNAFWIIFTLLIAYLILHTAISYRKNREINMIPYILICNGVLLFLPIYMLSIREFEEPLPLTSADSNLMNLLKMFLILVVLGIIVLIVDRALIRTRHEKVDSARAKLTMSAF